MQIDHPYLYQPRNEVFTQRDRQRQRAAQTNPDDFDIDSDDELEPGELDADADADGRIAPAEPAFRGPVPSSEPTPRPCRRSTVRSVGSYPGRRQFGLAFWGALLLSIVVFFFVAGLVMPMAGSMAGY